MSAASLADWLADPRVPLRRVEDLVDPAAFEATAILEQLEPLGAPPPVLFPRVRSLDGSSGEFRLLFNAYGALNSIAPALGSAAQSWPALLKDYVKGGRDLREPVRVERAAVRENVRRGAEVDLRILPWTRHVAGEGGEY